MATFQDSKWSAIGVSHDSNNLFHEGKPIVQAPLVLRSFQTSAIHQIPGVRYFLICNFIFCLRAISSVTLNHFWHVAVAVAQGLTCPYCFFSLLNRFKLCAHCCGRWFTKCAATTTAIVLTHFFPSWHLKIATSLLHSGTMRELFFALFWSRWIFLDIKLDWQQN
jgi:hypothetical protein